MNPHHEEPQKTTAVVIDLAGNGYVILSTDQLAGKDTVWLNTIRSRPLNTVEKDRYLRNMREASRQRGYEFEVIEHTDFYGRLPAGYEGRVV